jgi:hypothetical protein
VVVKDRVVLTAAHVLFDYRVLTFTPYSEVRWFFRKHKGEYEPVPQMPRGWYVREGYSALRQASGGQDISSLELQQLDVAAMYFVATEGDLNLPGRGGYGGYLSSDEPFNEWLMSDRLKMLVGYPLDGIDEVDRGKMHATPPGNTAFTWLYYWKVYATGGLRSYGGNSGGPLYVQYDDGRYYPAGIYLGRSSQTIVRAIDSDVVDLINRAEDSGQGAGNHTGGGVARWEAGVTGSPWLPGLFRVRFTPASVVTKGAGWRVAGGDDPKWIGDTNLYYPLIPGPFNIEFKAAAGYSAPPVRRVVVVVDQTTVIDAPYAPGGGQLAVSPAGGLVSSGYARGPFSPASLTYTLTNSGGASLNWAASKTAPWLSLSASTGTLGSGSSTTVTVSVNVNANGLVAGLYTDTVSFTNLTTGLGNTVRSVTLSVGVHPLIRLSEPRLLSDGRVAMKLQGVTNGEYSILVSSNLVDWMTNWTEVLRLTNTAGQTVFTNRPPPSTHQRFYRAKEEAQYP